MLKIIHCREMPLGKIINMDIITHPGAVRCIVVIAKNRKMRPDAASHVGNEWHKIVGGASRIFANLTGLMRPYRIEIT